MRKSEKIAGHGILAGIAAVLLIAVVESFLVGSIARAAEPAKPEPIDCILIAGQSNAVGFDADPDKLPVDEADQKILFWWRCGDPPPDEHDSTCEGKWTHLQFQPLGDPLKDKKVPRQYGNFRNPKGGFGPEMGLARTLYHKENKPLAILKAAWSGTSVQHDWNHAGPGGECYRGFVAEVKAARDAAAASGMSLRFRAIVWVQGESDANPHDAALYTDAVSDMLDTMRKDIDAPDLPALIGVNIHFGDMKKVSPKMQAIVDAQKALAAKDTRCVYVDTEGATLANGAHFDAAGTLEVGRRFAEALMKMQKERH
jgi:hypothetical protein